MRSTIIEINTTALAYNLNRVRMLAPQAKIVSMVKANAYGHGLKPCLEVLAKESDAFGVACLEEARQVRALGYDTNITLMEGVFTGDEMEEVIQSRVECVVHHQQQLAWLFQYQTAYQALGLKVWVKLNSGMNRLGFKLPEIFDVLTQLVQRGFDCVLTMHFANADEPNHPLNQRQIEQLQQIRQMFPQVKTSCCNSAAIFNWSDLHFDYVRPGIMLYGASPFADQTAQQLDLHAVMTFKTQVIARYAIQKGDQVGYGSRVTADRDRLLAIIAVGYGDGYPRAFEHENGVYIAGQYAPLFGRVSMDMSMVDITHLPTVQVGDWVELWGTQQTIDTVAAANGTIGYELLCRLTDRPYRTVVH